MNEQAKAAVADAERAVLAKAAAADAERAVLATARVADAEVRAAVWIAQASAGSAGGVGKGV